jgi:hypothetical protein
VVAGLEACARGDGIRLQIRDDEGRAVELG